MGTVEIPSDAFVTENGQNAPAARGKAMIPIPKRRLAAIKAPGIQYAFRSAATAVRTERF